MKMIFNSNKSVAKLILFNFVVSTLRVKLCTILCYDWTFDEYRVFQPTEFSCGEKERGKKRENRVLILFVYICSFFEQTISEVLF